MKAWQWLFCSWGLTAILMSPPPVAAAEVAGRAVTGKASTIFEWFDNGQGDPAEVVYQYLLVNGANLAGGVDLRLYGRLGEDLNNSVEADSRLYYGYFEKQNFAADLDIKLGRQFVASSAGAALVDGLSLKYRGAGPLTLSLFGGGDVQYYAGYNAEDLIWGAEAQGQFLAVLKTGLSYIQKWSDGRLANELIGANLDYEVPQTLNLYGDVQFNYLNDSISYFLGGMHYRRDPRWSVRTEYLYSLPVFESTSIYSVFAVDEYQEARAEATYRINRDGLRSFARYSREIYREFKDADVVEAGIEQIRRYSLAGYASLLYRRDQDGQDLEGFKLYGSWQFFKNLIWGAGVHVDVLERRIEEQTDETLSQRLWTDLTVPVAKRVELAAKVESVKSDLYSEYYRGRLRLDIRF